MEQSSDPQSVHIVGHDGLDHHHHHHAMHHHHHALHHHMPHAAALHHTNNLHHHGSLQEPLPTVEVVDQTATGLPLPPSILASYYAAAVAASGVDSSAAATANGTSGSSGGGPLGPVVGDAHGEGSISGGNHMAVGTPPATRKRGRPRKPPTPYNCAFVGCQKQITKRRFCAAHQKRRERARKKAQQQQIVGGQPTDVGAAVQGVGEDQQALLANLPPLPPMLQEAAVASGQPLMMPYQLQMMAELNKQQTYEQQAYDGQHHVAQQGYEPHHDGQPAYEIAQQAYEQAQQQISYAPQEETYEGPYAPRKRKREEEDVEDTSPETIAQTSEEQLPAHQQEAHVGDQDEAHNNSGLPPQNDQEQQHTQDHAHPNEHEQTHQEHWSASTLVVGQDVPLSGDDTQHDELGHGLHEHVQQAQPMEFQVVDEAATPHLPPQQSNERKTDLSGAEDGDPGGAEGHEARWV